METTTFIQTCRRAHSFHTVLTAERPKPRETGHSISLHEDIHCLAGQLGRQGHGQGIPTCPPLQNLEFPDYSCSPVAFQLDLPLKNLEFPDCSYKALLPPNSACHKRNSSSQNTIQLDLPPKNLEHQKISSSEIAVAVAFQLGLLPKKTQVPRLQL